VKIIMAVVAVAVAVAALTGCATKRETVVVNATSDMVILMSPTTAHVGTWQHGAWTDSGKMVLPAGWIAGPERKK
jgi:hypothetical protein